MINFLSNMISKKEKLTWNELFQIAFKDLGLTKKKFWNMTPKKFHIERLEHESYYNSKIRKNIRRMRILILGFSIVLIIIVLIFNL